MSSHGRLLCVPLLALAAAGTACTPFKGDPPTDGSAPDSTATGDASDAAPDADPPDSPAMVDASDAGAQCAHRAPPSKPTVVDAGGSLDLVLAVSESSNRAADDAGSYRVVGFDLDDTCTNEGQGPSCVEPGWATLVDHTDGVDGIDNAWGELGPYAVQVDAGTPTMLLRVRSYSGQSDDDQVDVALYAGLGVAPRDGDGGSPPLWDGNDRWNILPEMLALSASPSVDQPLYHDDAAYVSGGTLVAHFPKAVWSPGEAIAPYELIPANQIVLAGSLTRVGGLWVLRDLVADMRIRINDLLTAVAQFPSDGGVVCQDTEAYQLAEQDFCPFVDIASVPGPPSASCDALSSAGLFQAKQALLGDVLPPSPAPATCAPGIKPASDGCESLGN
jgi:hypothetical protein